MRPDATTTRRAVVVGAAAGLCVGPSWAADRLAAIEASVGGPVGVFALDTASGRMIAHRADERFPMCSTFKVMAAAAALKRVEAGAIRLDTFVRYGPADLLGYAPVTSRRVADGGMPLGDLLAAAIELSDNTAANLILKQIGGPAGWTAFARSLGDAESRLDRIEPMLNASGPGDPRDTTTPAAMAADLRKVVLGDVLSQGSRRRLQGWMLACKTGDQRLRAGLPSAWRVGDKTGSGGADGYASSNDIAVAWTPTRPIVIACYVTGRDVVPGAVSDHAIADVARLVAASFHPHG